MLRTILVTLIFLVKGNFFGFPVESEEERSGEIIIDTESLNIPPYFWTGIIEYFGKLKFECKV